MPRITVHVPDELLDSVRDRLGPNINIASVVESALIVLDTELKHDSRLAKQVRRLSRIGDAIERAKAERAVEFDLAEGQGRR